MNSEINRGELARQIRENPIFVESITATKAKIMNDWANTKWFQVRKREASWRLYRAVESIENHIDKTIKTGNMARKSQEDRERLKSVT